MEKWGSFCTLVAVSGGPDSVALIRAMAESASRLDQPKLHIGHINHGLRETESDLDQTFVEQLGVELDIPVHSIDAKSQNGPESSSEESLRNTRYEQLIRLTNQLGARYVVMGHNYDDQVETILFRILRGTGIGGLSGIPAYRLIDDSVTLVRPLLNTKRTEIVAYLETKRQKYRIDQSNLKSEYTRNYLRNELLPDVKQRFGNSVDEAITRLGVQASQIDRYLDEVAEQLEVAILRRDESHVELNCKYLQSKPAVVLRQFVFNIWKRQQWPRQALSFQWLQQIANAIQTDYDTVLNLPCDVRFEKQFERARFVLSGCPKKKDIPRINQP